MYSDILSCIYSDILSGILSGICSDILSGIYSGILTFSLAWALPGLNRERQISVGSAH